ncbi:MAG: sensor histidine kinase [Alkaliphilus sp.]|nr:MAG: sensor histidine kinase [Alkaliphilus sp.]
MIDYIRKFKDRKKSVHESIINRMLIASLTTSVMATFIFVIIVTLYSNYNVEIKNHLNHFMEMNTNMLPVVALIFTVSVLGSASVATIYFAIPLSNRVKKILQRIEESHELLSRGKLGTRLESTGFQDVDRVCSEFNIMAERTEKQVESLQRLINENKILILETEREASLTERKKIARDLHDAVSQQLFAISISLKAINNLVEANPNKAKKILEKVEEMAQTAQKELRALILQLRPIKLKGIPIHEALVILLKEISKDNESIYFSWEIKGIQNVFVGVEDCLYRIAQEVFSNIIRHAEARNIYIKFYSSDKVLYFFVEDDGIGFDIANSKKSSYGLSNMKERVEEIGGRIDFISVVGKGTRVEIRVPLYHAE